MNSDCRQSNRHRQFFSMSRHQGDTFSGRDTRRNDSRTHVDTREATEWLRHFVSAQCASCTSYCTSFSLSVTVEIVRFTFQVIRTSVFQSWPTTSEFSSLVAYLLRFSIRVFGGAINTLVISFLVSFYLHLQTAPQPATVLHIYSH